MGTRKKFFGVMSGVIPVRIGREPDKYVKSKFLSLEHFPSNLRRRKSGFVGVFLFFFYAKEAKMSP